MLVFRKIWRALFSGNTPFDICPFALLPTYFLIKELSNGGGTFIFNVFHLRPFTKIVFTDDQMLETINCRKATYTDTNLLHYLSFNLDVTKFTWNFIYISLLLTLVAFLNKLFDITFNIVPEKSIWNLLYRWISSTVRSHGSSPWSRPHPLWTSLIVVCCRSVEDIFSLVFVYINFPWSI